LENDVLIPLPQNNYTVPLPQNNYIVPLPQNNYIEIHTLTSSLGIKREPD
jgi:hypothetical protein